MTVEWVTIGDARLALGDCLDILPTLEAWSVDAVVTDIPFNVGKKYGTYDDNQPIDEYSIFINNTFAQLARLCKDESSILVKVPTKYLHVLMQGNLGGLCYKWTIGIYVPNSMKPIAKGFNQLGLVLWLYKDKPLKTRWANDAFKITRIGNASEVSHIHPNQMDEAVVIWLVDSYSSSNSIVLDPFMGSGTTGVACARLGRKFIGIEISPEYFEIAVKRITEAQQQLRLGIEA